MLAGGGVSSVGGGKTEDSAADATAVSSSRAAEERRGGIGFVRFLGFGFRACAFLLGGGFRFLGACLRLAGFAAAFRADGFLDFVFLGFFFLAIWMLG